MDLMTTGDLPDRSWLTLAAWDGHRIDHNGPLIHTNVSDKEGGGCLSEGQNQQLPTSTHFLYGKIITWQEE